MTTSEYLQTPETVLPRELAFGVLRVAEAPTIFHQRTVRDLLIALTAFVDARRLGEVLPAPVDVILDSQAALIVQPDLLFVAEERSEIVGDRIVGAPDLVVEVLSPHSRIGSTEERIGWFARYGVRECWLVDLSRRQIAVLTFEDGTIAGRTLVSGVQTIPSTVLPGFTLTPSGIFGWAWAR
jgi:Uma2 family endonuclease